MIGSNKPDPEEEVAAKEEEKAAERCAAPVTAGASATEAGGEPTRPLCTEEKTVEEAGTDRRL